MPIPDDVFRLVRTVMQRSDFAYLEWDVDRREWIVGLVADGRRPDGELKRRHLFGERLSIALQRALSEPVVSAAQRAPRAGRAA